MKTILDFIPVEPRDFTLATSCKNNLLKLIRKEITPQEFYKEIAYSALKSINELCYQYPAQVIIKMREYSNLSSQEKKSVSSRFWQDEEVKNYLDEKLRRKNQNKSNWEWLCVCKRRMETYAKKDTLSLQKILNVMGTYPERSLNE